MPHPAHLFATCRDDHAATPTECRADMLGLLARTEPPAPARVDRDLTPPHGLRRPLPGTIVLA